MIGFLIGTAGLIGLAKMARHRHGYGRFAYGACGPGGGAQFGGFGPEDGEPGWHPRHGHPFAGRGGFGRGRFSRRMLRGLFERLETSPGQEKVILQAVEAVQAAAAKMKDELPESRASFTRALRGEHFDGAAMNETFARHDALMEGLRTTLVGELSRVHEALDDRQRRELADLLERLGRGGGGGFGPFGPRYV